MKEFARTGVVIGTSIQHKQRHHPQSVVIGLTFFPRNATAEDCWT
jgi:hypothetical protein